MQDKNYNVGHDNIACKRKLGLIRTRNYIHDNINYKLQLIHRTRIWHKWSWSEFETNSGTIDSSKIPIADSLWMHSF